MLKIYAAKYFVESEMHFFGYFDNRKNKFIWNRNVFNPTFYKCNMSLLNKNTYFFKNKSYCPKLLNNSVCLDRKLEYWAIA